MKKTTIRLSSAGPQLVRDMLNSKWMQGYAFTCVGYYVLYVLSSIMQESDMIFTLAMMLIHGFVAAESLILYQRKEGRNLRHLSIFCLIGMIVLFLLCLFLGSVVYTLNAEYSTQSEEILQLWTDADLSTGMPYMILSVVSIGLSGFAMLFLWKALGMSADMLEHKGSAKNWYLPAGIFIGVNWLLSLAGLILQPGDWASMTVNIVLLLRDACLTMMMILAAKAYKEKIG